MFQKLSEEEAESAGLENVVGQPAISVTFNEAVRDVLPSDLTVNGSQAVSVNGQGPGPYLFTYRF